MAENKMLLVAGILEGRRFPRRPKCHLTVEAKFDGEILSTDPVAHKENPVFTTELAWELDKKTYQQHKLQRTPMKLQCFAIDEHERHKDPVGYCVIDIRSIASKPKKPNWYPLLSSKYHKTKPEIRVLVSLEDEPEGPKKIIGEKVHARIPRSEPELLSGALEVLLDEKDGFYRIGRSSNEDQMFILSVTIASAKNLVKLLPSSFEVDTQSGFYFYYNLFGNEVTNDPFSNILRPEFTAERASVRIKTNKENLKEYFKQNTTFEAYFCCKSQALAVAKISVLPFIKDIDQISSQQAAIEGLFTLSRPGNGDVPSAPNSEAVVGLSLILRNEESKAEKFPGGGSPIVASGGSTKSNKGSSKQRWRDEQADKLPIKIPAPNKSESSGNQFKKGFAFSDDSTPHHYSFSIDLRSLSQMDLDYITKCFCRYTYAFFGLSAPVLTNPPVEISRNSEVLLPNSFCAFEFATQEALLHETLSRVPLVVETWQREHSRRDLLLGSAQIDLSNIFRSPKTSLKDGHQRQVYTCKLPVLDSTSSRKKVAMLQVVIGLEDLGPVQPMQLPAEDTNQSVSSVSQSSDVVDAQPNIEQPDTRKTMEYQAALELEMWKEQQEKLFMNELKQKEVAQMKLLAEEWKRKDTEREITLKRRVDEYNNLEERMRHTIADLERREKKIANDEMEFHRSKNHMLLEHETRTSQLTEAARRVKEDCEHKIAMEKTKMKQLEEENRKLQERVTAAERRYHDKENEFINHRSQEQFTPEAKLQAEINLLHLEKTELERKVESITKSKIHYKQQWGRALRELAKIKQGEQVAAKQRLKLQQDELDTLRLKFMANEEKKVAEQDKSELKDVRNQLQELLNKKQENLLSSEIIPQHTGLTKTISVPLHNYHNPGLDNRIAKLIEERDTLLQTGVYRNDDQIIVELDQQIRECLNKAS